MPEIQTLSLVIPVYNEEETLPLLRTRIERLFDELAREHGVEAEAVLVDDGSADLSPAILRAWAERDRRIKVIRLSRNFGHQAALSCGLDHASGDAVVFMDADLQDPPELIPEMLARARDGCEVVYARRLDRAGETLWKRATAWLFYRFMRLLIHRDLPPDTGEFRLVTGGALEALRGLGERHRFLRGLSVWVGFRRGEVVYRRPPRAAGRTKFSTLKMASLAWDAAVSFSRWPLTLAAVWGTLVSLFGLGYLVYTLWRYFAVGDTVPGWATLVVLICLVGGSILVSLGIVGSYVGRIFEEVKQRPLYVVMERWNLPLDGGHAANAAQKRDRVPRPVGGFGPA